MWRIEKSRSQPSCFLGRCWLLQCWYLSYRLRGPFMQYGYMECKVQYLRQRELQEILHSPVSSCTANSLSTPSIESHKRHMRRSFRGNVQYFFTVEHFSIVSWNRPESFTSFANPPDGHRALETHSQYMCRVKDVSPLPVIHVRSKYHSAASFFARQSHHFIC